MVQTSPTPFEVGRAFVHQYYTLLHQAPHMLHRFYSTDSTFIHGGVDRPGSVEQPAVGPDSISQRINDLNLRDCHAKIRQVDSHPTIGDGVVVQVTGELSNNGDPMRRFMQTFVLAPRQPKKYYVQNDIFRYQDEVFDEGSDDVDEDDRSGSHIYGDTISNTDKVSNAGSSTAITVPSQQQPLLVTGTARPQVEEPQPLPPRNAHATLGNNQSTGLPNQVARQQEQQQSQQQHAGSNNLNGFSSGTESISYGGLSQQQDSAQSQTQPSPRSVTQENQQQTNGGNAQNQQQQVKQTAAPTTTTTTTTEGQRPEGIASYAGIAKMNPSVGSTSNVNTNSNVNSTSTAVSRGAPTVSGVTPTTSQQSNAARTSVKAPLTATNRPNSNSQSGQQRSGNNYYPQNNRGSTVSTVPNEQQIFVGSLPMDLTREALIELFSKYGNVLDAKTYTSAHDVKKNFAFVAFDNTEVATNLIQSGHVMYNDSIRLNIEQKSSRNPASNNNLGGNFNNGSQGIGRNNNYSNRGGNSRGGNRAPYRGSGSNQRRGGFNQNASTFVGNDENNNDYRTNKVQIPIQQQ